MIFMSYAASLKAFRWDLIAGARDRAMAVTVVGPFPEGYRDLGLLSQYGVGAIRLDILNHRVDLLRDLRSLLETYRVLQAAGPHIVLAYTLKPILIAGLGSRSARVPKRVAWLTGLGYWSKAEYGTWPRRLVPLLTGFSLRAFNDVLVQNSHDEHVVRRKKWVGQNIRITRTPGSGVRLDKFRPAELPTVPTFLMMARVVSQKGVREYLEACEILKKLNPHWQFEYAGEPYGDLALLNMLEDAHIRGIIHYFGYVENAEKLLRSCSVYVLPSYYAEGQPRTVIEALATGRPVITTSAAGCNETIENGKEGLLVPPGDSGALADSMLELGNDGSLVIQMGAAARRRAVRHYDSAAVANLVLDTIALPHR